MMALACKKRKWGGTSAGRNENGWMCDVKVKDIEFQQNLRD